MIGSAKHQFLVSRACTLGEACREAGYDQGGKRCPDCPLRQLCQSEDRWLVKRFPVRGRNARRFDA